MNPSTQKMALIVIAGAITISVLLAFANLLSRARDAKNKNNNTEVSKEGETPLPPPIKTVRQETTPTPTPTPTIEDEAIAEANKWLEKKLSPVDSNNQRCGLEKKDNVITEVLRLEKLGTGTVSNGSYSEEVERRNSRLIWSGQVKFKADLFQIYFVMVEDNRLKISSPEWDKDFYFSVNVSKNESGWKVADAAVVSYNSSSSRPIDQYSAFPCSSILSLHNKIIKKVAVSTPIPTEEPTPISTPLPTPENSTALMICDFSGLRATKNCPKKAVKFFRDGAAPKDFCTFHNQSNN